MIIIAEISDKMASIPVLWALMMLFSIPFLIGIANRRLAWFLLPFAIMLSGWIGYTAYHEAFLEKGMSEAIHSEMGSWWIFNSLITAILPAVVSIGILMLRKREKTQP